MSDWQKAKICWIPASAGGRQQPPAGPRYSTVARFHQEDGSNDWSVLVEFEQPPDAMGCMEGHIRFLAPQAPYHLLRPNYQFQLVEGARIVATVEILPDQNSLPVNGVPKSTPLQRVERVEQRVISQ